MQKRINPIPLGTKEENKIQIDSLQQSISFSFNLERM